MRCIQFCLVSYFLFLVCCRSPSLSRDAGWSSLDMLPGCWTELQLIRSSERAAWLNFDMQFGTCCVFWQRAMIHQFNRTERKWHDMMFSMDLVPGQSR